DCVVTEVRAPADEPSGERRTRIVEHLDEGLFPVDQLRLLPPERLALTDRSFVKLLQRGPCPGYGHWILLRKGIRGILRRRSQPSALTASMVFSTLPRMRASRPAAGVFGGVLAVFVFTCLFGITASARATSPALEPVADHASAGHQLVLHSLSLIG